jgi:hypothetical protein
MMALFCHGAGIRDLAACIFAAAEHYFALS